MQLRKRLSLLLIAMLTLSPSVALMPAGGAWAADAPTLESSHGGDDKEMMEGAVTFLVRIENLSGDSDLPTPFAPGVWVLHDHDGPLGPLFTSGEKDRGVGLEALAEDGDPTMLAEFLTVVLGLHAGVFNTPVGADAPEVNPSGGVYEFEVTAAPDTPYLTFATMLVQSNDLFIAPDEMGIALFDMDGMAITGMDVTEKLILWDAGTEANEEPGAGPNQAPRQPGPNSGPDDEMETVHAVDDGFSYPDVAALVKVTIEPVMMADDEEMKPDEDEMKPEMKPDEEEMKPDKDDMKPDEEEMKPDKDDMKPDKDDMMAADDMMDKIMLMEDSPTPYSVMSGDTLGSIARRAYGRSKYWSVICSANSLENCNLIHVGDGLTLPTQAEAMSMMDEKMMMDKDAMMAADAMMDKIMLMEGGPTAYSVMAGDTLGSISKRAYGNTKYYGAICINNALENCDLIHVGNELMLPTQAQAEQFVAETEAMGPGSGPGMAPEE